MVDGASLRRYLALPRLEEAHQLSSNAAIRTPIVPGDSLGLRGGSVELKVESLQRTGSFKYRGALNKLRHARSARGVVAGSAGNHAQSLACAAQSNEIDCEVFMPIDAPASKVAAAKSFGAVVHLGATSVDECVELARVRADESGATFVHPFDDLDVIVGQAGVGIEIADDCPSLAAVVAPIGGGGLISGIAAAVRQKRSDVRIIGVQAANCAAYGDLVQTTTAVRPNGRGTLADGIAIKRPGALTGPMVEELVDEIVTVSESEIADAMGTLLGRFKLVVEGAGAVSLAALLAGVVRPTPDGATVLVLSGGNVDPGVLSRVVIWQEALRGRRIRISTRIPDRPGGLATVLAAVARSNANLISVDHVREHVDLGVKETGVELTLELSGPDHAETVRQEIRGAGFEVAQ